ncbi:MAG: hypothetical protein KZQ77_00290 [Candidatus Thiodiazotropha sp. (ex Notomyrtea botanica)]|nr:hypothetical protein [Candidatus Thiodiazotropha sp. (ex Notomyrtea botanica)]
MKAFRGLSLVYAKNPYSIDTLLKLPARKSILAAYHFEVVVDIQDRKRLDFVAGLRLNEILKAFDIPAPLLLGCGSFNKTVQILIE